MRSIQTLSKSGKVAITCAVLALLVGSGVAYADSQHFYTSDYEFQVIDEYQPNIVTWVNGSFSSQPIDIYVNMSSQYGVSQLNGTYSVTVQIWNDTVGDFVNFQSLASNQTITLTPDPITLHYVFTTDTPGDYNVHVEFTATSASSG